MKIRDSPLLLMWLIMLIGIISLSTYHYLPFEWKQACIIPAFIGGVIYTRIIYKEEEIRE